MFRSFYAATGRSYLLPWVDRMMADHYRPRDVLDAELRANLAALLTQAFTTVPYYRDLGIHAGPVKPDEALDVLARMPVLTKEIIRQAKLDLLSERPGKKLRWNTSGGSTGEPVRLLQDARMRNSTTANQLLFMRWLGFQVGESHLLIWGVPDETVGAGVPLRERIFRWIHHEVYLNCYEITEEHYERWAAYIRQHRPAHIEAYVDAIHELSLYLKDRRINVPSPSRGIITSAGVLTPERRAVIEEVFGCPVLNRYGSREVSDMACSCLAGSELHLSEAMCHLEIVDEAGQPCPPGVEGDVLVTLFTNHSMPLIRYKVEDRAVWAAGDCACGRTTRRLASVNGRTNDYLLARDGTRINGIALTTLLYSVDGMKRFQYRQASAGRASLAVVPAEGVSREVLTDRLKGPLASLKTMLGSDKAELVFVDDIQPSPSGKYRYILNECPRP